MGKRKPAPPKKGAPKVKSHTVSEDGKTVTRHYAEGDSVQKFDTTQAAASYAASIK